MSDAIMGNGKPIEEQKTLSRHGNQRGGATMTRRNRTASPHLRCLTRGDATYCALDKTASGYTVTEAGQAKREFNNKPEAWAAYQAAFARQAIS